jgi:hypothetical protein
VDEIPDLRAWQAAYLAFKECVGGDTSIKLQYTLAWAAAMNAVMAYDREMRGRDGRDRR